MQGIVKGVCVGAIMGLLTTPLYADDTSKQIQMLNSQLQVQLQRMQESQEKQIHTLNAQLQKQLKETQTKLQSEMQAMNASNQKKMKAMHDDLQAQIKQIHEMVLTGGAMGAAPEKAAAPAAPAAQGKPAS